MRVVSFSIDTRQCLSSSFSELGGLEIIFLIMHCLLNCNSPGSVITDVWPNEKT